ncbi:tetratricopeptide repeat protein [candidate division TA06 bacterium]|nr:tetratricopeptide repeat protein [candidate division TA06 bacterium]
MAKVDQIRTKAAEFFQKGDYAKAVLEYKKVLELEPGNASVYNFIGDAFVKLNNIDEAVTNYMEAAKGYGNDALYNNAIAVCKKILRSRKDDPEIYKMLGDLYIQQGLINEAITNLLEYSERKIKEGKPDLAFPVYHQIVELNPQNLAIRSKLADMYLSQKRVPEAIEEFTKLAQAYRENGRMIEAEAIDAKVRSMKGETAAPSAVAPAPAPEIRPQQVIDELTHHANPEIQLEVPPQREKPAMDIPTLSIQREPEKPAAPEPPKQDWATNVELGDLLVEIGSTQEALDQYHTAANGYLGDGNISKSIAIYKKIAELQPLELRSRQKLVEISLQANQPEAMVDAYLGLAECLYRRELKEQAAAVYQKVLEIDPVNETALESLSLLLPEMPEGAMDTPSFQAQPEPKAPPQPIAPPAAPAPSISIQPPSISIKPPSINIQSPVPETAPAASASFDFSSIQPAISPQMEPAAPETPSWQMPVQEPGTGLSDQGFMHSQPSEEQEEEHSHLTSEPHGGQPAQDDNVHWGREMVEGGRQSRVKFSVADDDQSQTPQAQEEYLSLNDILAEFKEGVYQSIKQEDFQGHYDLGIAYKEMGLVQEAIAEFQISSKGDKERLKSFEMLGICFMERGEYKFAIRQMERGLATPGFEEEAYMGLRYNLAQSYESVGEIDNAIKAYEEIYSADVSFKDVAQKLQQLKPAAAAPDPKPAPAQPVKAPLPAPPPPRPAAQPVPQPTQAPLQAQPASLPPRPAVPPAMPRPAPAAPQPQFQPPSPPAPLPAAPPRPSIAQPQPQMHAPTAAAPAPRPAPPQPAAPAYAPQPPARPQEEMPSAEMDTSPKPKPIPSKLKKPEKQRISYV